MSPEAQPSAAISLTLDTDAARELTVALRHFTKELRETRLRAERIEAAEAAEADRLNAWLGGMAANYAVERGPVGH